MKKITVADLRRGEEAELIRISARARDAKRLRQMGISEGARVVCVSSGISGDPAAYRLNGTVIALAKTDAKRLFCRR